MAFLELNPELEGFARRLELEDEGPGPLWTCSLLPVAAPLDYTSMVQRLVETARLRGLVK